MEKEKQLQKQRAEAEKLEAELKAKKEAEIKAEKERQELEIKAKKKAEKLAKAPIKKQISVWVDSFELPDTDINNEVTSEIIAKFEAFKKWSKTKIDEL